MSCEQSIPSNNNAAAGFDIRKFNQDILVKVISYFIKDIVISPEIQIIEKNGEHLIVTVNILKDENIIINKEYINNLLSTSNISNKWTQFFSATNVTTSESPLSGHVIVNFKIINLMFINENILTKDTKTLMKNFCNSVKNNKDMIETCPRTFTNFFINKPGGKIEFIHHFNYNIILREEEKGRLIYWISKELDIYNEDPEFNYRFWVINIDEISVDGIRYLYKYTINLSKK